MDARQQRGLQIAEQGHILKYNDGWKVLSQSGNGHYFVRLDNNPSCTCPDFELRQQPCKHIYAVECLITWETVINGSNVITTTKTQVVKVTYKQNWPPTMRRRRKRKSGLLCS